MSALHSDTRLVYSTYINTTAQIDVISCSFVEYSVTKPIPGLDRRITKIIHMRSDFQLLAQMGAVTEAA
jgi:hypothetical protein